MQMSAIYPSVPARAEAGFTLLELLVVLVLLAGLSAVALPQLYRIYESGERNFERARVLDAVAALPHRARVEGRALQIAATGSGDAAVPSPVQLPDGWRLQAVGQPVKYARSGVCLGGQIELHDGTLLRRYTLPAPHCRPE